MTNSVPFSHRAADAFAFKLQYFYFGLTFFYSTRNNWRMRFMAVGLKNEVYSALLDKISLILLSNGDVRIETTIPSHFCNAKSLELNSTFKLPYLQPLCDPQRIRQIKKPAIVKLGMLSSLWGSTTNMLKICASKLWKHDKNTNKMSSSFFALLPWACIHFVVFASLALRPSVSAILRNHSGWQITPRTRNWIWEDGWNIPRNIITIKWRIPSNVIRIEHKKPTLVQIYPRCTKILAKEPEYLGKYIRNKCRSYS